jgi:hypothetical protein
MFRRRSFPIWAPPSGETACLALVSDQRVLHAGLSAQREAGILQLWHGRKI